MSDNIRFSSITLACPAPSELAAFYAEILGGEVTFVHENEWATMRSDGVRIEFMGVNNYVPPRWPQDSALVHLDLYVDDLEAAAARVQRAGASRFAEQPNFEHCLVFADPVGHPFCLSTIDDVE